MGIDFSVKSPFPQISKQLMADFSVGGVVQKEWDYIVLNGMRKYLPKREGILETSGDTNTVLGNGEIVYRVPYARRLYHNPQYNFSKEKNPLAGGVWAERAYNDNGEQWANLLQNFIDRR